MQRASSIGAARNPVQGSGMLPAALTDDPASASARARAGTDSASPQAAMVHTTETIRLRYFLDLLMEKQRPVMLVGNAGTGKSVLMWDKLEALGTDEYLVQSVPLNFYTTSAMLQGKAGRASSQPCTGMCHRVLQCLPPTHLLLPLQPSLKNPWRRNQGEFLAHLAPEGLSTSLMT